ncbi:eukaryotic aspartyl protease [Colletotrichum graminicola]|uniref:Eukaryotic aspartyl protease n=1 Tax=Colletotrichum graminicola (strain M1.001 / M2 / FGSC 10212) TaxID=645133 RepID=E3QS16_COLGM|nr:eukaryotic aspartyl protease [Colletotrichum graminicola M1.001]EFQ33654.1 eukaryotic aspartyl protease [Colletotrichum graminicola M1.001]WDK10771.1 eukaryotic aspartyl protease [Colletotrichum graminicola]
MTASSFVSALAAGLALASTAAALPAATQQESNFSVEQVPNTRYVRSGPLALAKAYRKYKIPLPQDLASAVSNITNARLGQRDTGSETANPEPSDSEYLCPVKIGTPAQTLNLDFDTGSSDLWVFYSSTPSSERDGQTVYNPSKSRTASLLSGESWSISYGDGSSSSGIVYSDVVSVGGLSVSGQAVEVAQTVSDEFSQDSDNDGLLGLGFSSINTVSPNQQTTFFDTATPQLSSPVFTADLKHNKAGKYNFGYIDNSAYTGSITYTSVDNSQGFWGFTSSGYQVGSSSFTKKSYEGIADTGTTLLLLPDSIVKAYYKQISGAKYDSSQGGYVFPCAATPPSFTFGVGSARITVPGSYMNFEAVSSSSCYGGIQSNSDIGFTIFGDIALKAAFVVFDGGNTQLGWASKTLS